MKKNISVGAISFLLLVSFQMVRAQSNNKSLEKFSFLLGNWVGEGNGQPGSSVGYVDFSTDLDNHVVIAKGHSNYPATANRSAFEHNDFLIIHNGEDNLSKALYVDNEGHAIDYSISFSEDQKSIIFTSSIVTGRPVFRLSYSEADKDHLNIKFEMAQPDHPEAFTVYVQGKVKRNK